MTMLDPHKRASLTPASRWGFSLLELLVVLGILGLLTTAAVARLNLPITQARREAARERWILLDRQLREQARHQGRTLKVTLALAERSAKLVDGASSEKFLVRPEDFPESMICGPGDSSLQTLRLDYLPDGTTCSYATAWKSTNSQSDWLLIVGRTGQTLTITKREQVDALLANLTDRLDID